MGVERNAARALIWARQHGVDFTATALIGRSFLYLGGWDLEEVFSQHSSIPCPPDAARKIMTEADGYAEPFFRRLGATTVDSFDASSYEKATHIVDMNTPLPPGFRQKYSLVYDGGTLEHVFNFPVAVKNCMEMVAPGGHFISVAPTNNFMGHGFYQFSPELFYNIFSEPNGYRVVKMAVFEDRRFAPWYEVKNPADIRTRVILANHYPTHLLVIARREKVADIFKTTPQQSDYQVNWRAGVTSASGAQEDRESPWWKSWIPTALKVKIKIQLHLLRQRLTNPYRPKFFTPWRD